MAIAVSTQAWEEAGYTVVAATPSAKAARILQEATGVDVQTITKALGDYELPWGAILSHHLTQLKNELLGRPTRPVHKPGPVRLDGKTILLVDEAGMVGTREMLMLAQQAERSGATLVLVGDANQLPPVRRGAPFESLSNRVGCVELTDIQRQKAEWARQVAKLAAAGEVPRALQLLAEHNAVHTHDTVEKAAASMVAKWAALGAVRDPHRAIMLANTNDECEALNQLAQRRRVAENAINSKRSIQIRDVDAARGIDYANNVFRGDQVLITRNSSAANVHNGMVGTVTNINTITQNLTVTFPNGQSAMIPAQRFPHLRLGYAVTTYKAQGDSQPDVLVLATESPQSQPAFYVQMTRAFGTTEIFTTKGLWNPDKEPVHKSPLAQYLSRQPDLRLASDLMDITRAEAEGAGSTLPPLEINFPKTPPPPDPPSVSPVPGSTLFPTGHRTSSTDAARSQSAAPANPPVDERPIADPPRQPVTATSLPLPTAGTWPLPSPPKRRRKKKKRATDSTEADTQEVIDQEEAVIPPVEVIAPEAATESELIAPVDRPPVLPSEFFIIPVPSLAHWRPIASKISPDRIPLLPQDFLTTPRRPIVRSIPSRAITPRPASEPLASPIHSAEPQSISIEDARNPAMRRARREKLLAATIAQVANEHGVPPAQVEVVNIREWEEESGNIIKLWTEITFLIRTYGPLDLIKLIAFPI